MLPYIALFIAFVAGMLVENFTWRSHQYAERDPRTRVEF